MSRLQVGTSWISSTYYISLGPQGPLLLNRQKTAIDFGLMLTDFRYGISSFFISGRMKIFLGGGEIRPCVHLILENWVARLIFTTALSASKNAAARSCDKCLIVLTDTAHLILRFPFKCPFLNTRKGNVLNRTAV